MTKTLGTAAVVLVAGAMHKLLDWGSATLIVALAPPRPEGFPAWALPAMNWGEHVVVVVQLLLAYGLVRRAWPESVRRRVFIFAGVVLLLNVRMFDLLRLASSLAWARFLAFTDLVTLTVLFATALFVAAGVEWVSPGSQA